MKIYYCLILSAIAISCSKGTSSSNNGNNSTSPPTVITTAITNIAQTSATTGGTITDSGGATITMRGICYNWNPHPTISDGRINNGPGAGNFTCILASLTRGTDYYVRAYATNSAGTGYGNEIKFTSAGYRESQIVAGDIVFAVSSDGNSALLAAPTDVRVGDSVSFSYWPMSGPLPWTFPLIGASYHYNFGDGEKNTDLIVNHPQCPQDAAAKLARNYVSPVDGHGGYYLPHSNEMFTLLLGRTRGYLGNAPFYQDSLLKRYWCSDESSSISPELANIEWYDLIPSNISGATPTQKTIKCGIRPIRKIGTW